MNSVIIRWNIANVMDNITVSYYTKITVITWKRPTACNYSATEILNRRNKIVSTFQTSRARVQDIPGSNLGPDTGYLN
jgi:hypothetical protein